MRSALHRPRSILAAILVLVLLPAAAWSLSALLQWWLAAHPGEESFPVDERVRRIERFFSRLAEEAAATATLALETNAPDAYTSGAGPILSGRLEGIGVYLQGEEYFDWEGTPSELPAALAATGGPGWRILREGLRTRLVVFVGPDDTDRCASATFLLDSRLGDSTFSDLLPPATATDSSVVLRLVDSDNPPTPAVSEWGVNPLSAPDGTVLSTLEIVQGVEPVASPGPRIPGAPLAAILFALALAWVFPWPAWCNRTGGFLGACACLVLVRSLLLAAHAPALLLPRTLGSPSLFGTRRFLGLAGSPADLFLTVLAIFLGVLALRTLLRGAGAGAVTRFAVTPAAAMAATAATVLVSISLARDCTIDVLQVGEAVRSAGHALLLVSLTMLFLSAAELIAMSCGSVRWTGGSASGLSGRIVTAVLLLPLAALSGVVILSARDRQALDRLQSEYGPQVLEQSSRRSVALRSALHHAAAHLSSLPTGFRRSPGSRFLAYDLWIGSALFQSGYKSSLGILDAEGNRISHFGFDMPPLLEEIEIPEGEAAELVLVEEVAEPVSASRSGLLHAHLPVLRGGRVAGLVVGHVPDDPDNLPFLPGSRPYLGALGVGGPLSGERDLPPEYVLYNSAGIVRFSTLFQPPAWKTEFDKAAFEERTVRVIAGGEPYFALPLVEIDRLHLLLLPAPTALERMSAFVRLMLLGLLLLAVLELASRLARPGGFRSLSGSLRISFYRKLVAALLLASVLPLIGLSLILKGYIESRGEATLVDEAVQRALVAQRVVEDYAGLQPEEGENSGSGFSDHLMAWLREVVGQEIHLYENGVLEATSKRELFASGLLLPRLPGEVYRKIIQENSPPMVAPAGLGRTTIPVAYAPVTLADPSRKIVLGVPLVLQQQAIDRAVNRVVETLLLTTVFLAGLLVFAAAIMARTVARPVRELVGATARIADGDYATRLTARTRDEIAELVNGFNAMASALAAQRADLLQRKDYMEALLRNATTGVISTDADGSIVTINPAAAGLLSSGGAPPQPGESLEQAVVADSDLVPLAEALRAGGTPGATAEIDLARGSEAVRLRLVQVELPDPSGGPSGLLVLLEDVTDLMRKNQLEAWAEMARAIAHEIKNPLTPIQLSTEHLDRILRDRGILPSPEVESCLENVIRQVRALRQIASEFSAYAKLPDLKITPMDPAEFMRETTRPYSTSPPRGVEIVERYSPCPAVAIDERVLSRAVINLIENALQSMPDGGGLTLEASAEETGKKVRLTVRDTGPGLSPEVRSRLFEPYFSTRSSGTGLGLAIVRRSVEAHGGSMEVESREGEGTAFHIILPVDGGEPR